MCEPSTPVLCTKLEPPAPAGPVLARARLVDELEAAVDRPVTLVIAPAGAGKTTALTMWVARTDRRVAWLSLDPGDNEPLRFWSHVLAALSDAGHDLLGRVPTVGESAGTEVVAMLANTFAGCGERTVLVLDDLHFLTTSTVLDGLNLLLSQAPIGLGLVLAGRSRPDLASLPRARIHGHVAEIGAMSLRFDRAETAELLKAHGLALSPDQLNAVHVHTEGWAVGTVLAIAALRDGAPPGIALRDLGATGSGILEYLSCEVLDNCDATTRRFMLATSILDRLTGPLCDAVTGDEGGSERLRQLARRNLFLMPLEGGRWYRYHHLVADLLRAQLESERPSEVRELHRRASRWYRRAGMPDEAVRHAVAAGETREVTSLVESSPELSCFFEGLLLAGGDLSDIRRWLEDLPEPERLETRARLAVAWTLIGLNQLDLVEQWVSSLDSADARATRRDVRANTAILRGVLGRLTGDLSNSVAAARHGLALSASTAPSYVPALGGLGPNLYWVGELEEARELLRIAIPRLVPPRALLPLVTDLGHLALAEGELGDLERGAELAQQAIAVATHYGFEQHFVTAAAHLALARSMRDRVEPRRQERTLAVAEDRARRVGEPAVLLAVLLERADMLRRDERPCAADAATREAGIIAATGADPVALGRVFDRFAPPLEPAHDRSGVLRSFVEPLTERETSVLRLLRAGMTQRELGRELDISVNTAKTHTKAIYRKLGVHDREEALRTARELHWIS